MRKRERESICVKGAQDGFIFLFRDKKRANEIGEQVNLTLLNA